MEQLNIPPELQIPINYQAAEVSGMVKNLRPVLFRKGELYCCLLGPDIESGITGQGRNPQKAISDWERKVTDRIEHAPDTDQLALYLRHTLQYQ